MVVLFQWIFAHLLADFVLQTQKMVQHKKRLKARSWVLYLHCLLHGGLVYLFTPKDLWLIPVIVTVTHFLIDWWKLNRPENVVYFLIDQVLHLLVLGGLWLYWLAPFSWIPDHLTTVLQSRPGWITATGYLAVTWPMSYLLAFATKRWRLEAESSGLGMRSTSLSEAGKWIGIFERTLVFTFVVTGHFEGIGFLIAAKSILRLGDIKSNDARRESEYILIGTLMSFSISILTGLIVRALQ